MSTLYDQVAALDKGLADRWKLRTHDNPRHKLTPGDVDAIVSPLLKAKPKTKTRVFISEKQAEAIVTLVRATDFDKGGLARLRYWVQFAEDAIELDLKPLVTDDELSPITKALAIASNFSFTSPGTKIAYAPHHYMGIAQLIKKMEIAVFEAEMSDLSVLTKDDGEYRSNFNMLIVYQKLHDDAFSNTVVHETTHAIQDWLDKGAQRRFIEADAYIAGDATLDAPMFVGRFSDATFKASRFVIAGKAMPSNKDWNRAYAEVVKAYDADHTDGRELVIEAGKGETESVEYEAILTAIDKALELQDWAVNAIDGAVKDVSEAVREVLP
jgi:hypothetical protein